MPRLEPKMSVAVFTTAVIFYGACLVFIGLFVWTVAMLAHSFISALPVKTVFACIIGTGLVAGSLILFKVLSDLRDENLRFHHDMHTLLDDTDPANRAVADDEQSVINALNALYHEVPAYNKTTIDPRD